MKATVLAGSIDGMAMVFKVKVCGWCKVCFYEPISSLPPTIKNPGRRCNSVQSALGSLRGSCPYAREALANKVRAHPGFRQDLHHAINFLSLLNGIKDVFDPYVNMLRHQPPVSVLSTCVFQEFCQTAQRYDFENNKMPIS